MGGWHNEESEIKGTTAANFCSDLGRSLYISVRIHVICPLLVYTSVKTGYVDTTPNRSFFMLPEEIAKV